MDPARLPRTSRAPCLAAQLVSPGGDGPASASKMRRPHGTGRWHAHCGRRYSKHNGRAVARGARDRDRRALGSSRAAPCLHPIASGALVIHRLHAISLPRGTDVMAIMVRHRALASCLRMIFSDAGTLFRIMRQRAAIKLPRVRDAPTGASRTSARRGAAAMATAAHASKA
jgi:hypothetical protein